MSNSPPVDELPQRAERPKTLSSSNSFQIESSQGVAAFIQRGGSGTATPIRQRGGIFSRTPPPPTPLSGGRQGTPVSANVANGGLFTASMTFTPSSGGGPHAQASDMQKCFAYKASPSANSRRVTEVRDPLEEELVGRGVLRQSRLDSQMFSVGDKKCGVIFLWVNASVLSAHTLIDSQRIDCRHWLCPTKAACRCERS